MVLKSHYFVSTEQMLGRYRIILIVAGLLYTVWYFNYRAMVPDGYDSFYDRFVVGSAAISIAVLSYRFSFIKRRISFWFNTIAAIMYLHGFYQTVMNNMDLNYVWGAFVAVVGFGASVLTMEALYLYFGLAIVCSGYAYYLKAAPERWLYFTGIITVFIISFLSLRALLKVVTQLKSRTDELLELSAAVQTLFLPSRNDFENRKCRLHGFYRAAEKCGGDWWWYKIHEQRVQIIVGDVTGHGPGPAMMTASIASYLRALQSIFGTRQMSDILAALNKQVLDLADGTTQFRHCMSLAAVEVDFSTMTLHAWFAAAPMVTASLCSLTVSRKRAAKTIDHMVSDACSTPLSSLSNKRRFMLPLKSPTRSTNTVKRCHKKTTTPW